MTNSNARRHLASITPMVCLSLSLVAAHVTGIRGHLRLRPVTSSISPSATPIPI